MTVAILMDVKFWVVLISALTYMAIGALWYSPVLFGRIWLKESKITKEQMAGYGRALLGSFIASIFMSYVLGYFIAVTHSNTAFYGASVGFWTWLGFVATTRILDVLYTGKSWTMFAIDAGYLLASLLAMGAILGALGPF